MKIFQRVCRQVDHFLQRKSPRYKLWRICRALGIRPHKWQRDYVLNPLNSTRLPTGRRAGKTMAVMLFLFTHSHYVVAIDELELDPDFILGDRRRRRWYADEFCRIKRLCEEHGILAPALLTPDVRRYRL